ncbi:MAG TPA: serine/threonine-protein kinase, partial [Polyangiales bacterium]|nr:serine/threonine-protein kinase [Polyangiales bacterium]
VMEYLQGEPLGAALERALLSPHQVVRYLLPAMRGVSAAHAKGVVHRDLKPDNIFLCKNADGSDREPKVLDFGISKVTSIDGQLNPRLTRTGAVMGTPYYMSPEQLRDAAEIDERTDVYAFGVILYEALTGRVPFDAENYAALILEIATGTPKRPRQLRSEVPEGLERIVIKAMARDPDDRYANIDGLARALEPFSRASSRAPRKDRKDKRDSVEPQRASLSVTTPFVSDSPVDVPSRRPWLGAVAAAVLVLGGGGVWWALKPGSDGARAGEAAAHATPAPEGRNPGDVLGAQAPGPAAAKPEPHRDLQLAAGSSLDAGVDLARPAAPAAVVTPTAAGTAVEQPAANGDHRGRVPSGRSTEAPVRGRGRTGGLRTDEF